MFRLFQQRFLSCFLINLATHQVPNSLFSVVHLITVRDSPGENFEAQPDAFLGQPYYRSYFVTGLKAGNLKTLVKYMYESSIQVQVVPSVGTVSLTQYQKVPSIGSINLSDIPSFQQNNSLDLQNPRFSIENHESRQNAHGFCGFCNHEVQALRDLSKERPIITES